MPNYTPIAKNIGKMLGLTAKAIKKNKKLLLAGGIGTGAGFGVARLADDGHDKSDHINKKYAELNKEAITEKFIGPRFIKRLKDLQLLAENSPKLILNKKLRDKNFFDLLNRTEAQTAKLPRKLPGTGYLKTKIRKYLI